MPSSVQTALPSDFAARIVAVCDAYDAMTTERAYSPAVAHESACQELRDMAGTQFDPQVVEVFIAEVEMRTPAAPDAAIILYHFTKKRNHGANEHQSQGCSSVLALDNRVVDGGTESDRSRVRRRSVGHLVHGGRRKPDPHQQLR